jgi:4-amino-4-deoxy-L-arabinose transferase-like glycosyltransferase
MFVPVTCSACGKPFQVPEEAIGRSTACPWCQATVFALPVADTPAITTPGALLSLDEEPPLPSRRRRWLLMLALLVIVIAATLATIGVLRRKEGYLTGSEWRAFTPADQSCTIQLLGRAVEDAAAPESGQRRYLSEGWYSGTTTWLGWRNLNAAEVQIALAPEAWHDPQLTRLFDQERDWLKGRYGGSVTKDATISFSNPLTRELRLELPEGRTVERMIVHPTGPRPRLYFLGIAGKRFDPDGEEVKRLFDSFRVLD